MNDKENNNHFKLVLSQSDVIFCQQYINADIFNPFTRYSIDIRDILPKSINYLQKVLSRKKYNTVINEYDNYSMYNNILNSYKNNSDMIYNPEINYYEYDDKLIKGVEFKLGLYINNKTIVERIFYVDSFNSKSRWSTDLIDTFTEISDMIYTKIRNNDINNMWNDYDLINKKGLTINQIRELSLNDRNKMIKSLIY